MTYRISVWWWAGGVALALSSASAWSDSPLNKNVGDTQGQHPAAAYPNSGDDTSQQPGGASQPSVRSVPGRQGAGQPPQVLKPDKEQPKVAAPRPGGAPTTRHQPQ